MAGDVSAGLQFFHRANRLWRFSEFIRQRDRDASRDRDDCRAPLTGVRSVLESGALKALQICDILDLRAVED
jgi:hypothetical protein